MSNLENAVNAMIPIITKGVILIGITVAEKEIIRHEIYERRQDI